MTTQKWNLRQECQFEIFEYISILMSFESILMKNFKFRVDFRGKNPVFGQWLKSLKLKNEAL